MKDNCIARTEIEIDAPVKQVWEENWKMMLGNMKKLLEKP